MIQKDAGFHTFPSGAYVNPGVVLQHHFTGVTSAPWKETGKDQKKNFFFRSW